MSAPNGPAAAASQAAAEEQQKAVLNYLKARGFDKIAEELQAEISKDPTAAQAAAGGSSINLDELASRNAPPAVRTNSQAGTVPGVRRRPDQALAAGQMLTDPPSWEKGYEGLKDFVENSLDIHRPELAPILLPLFVHSYLDLVQVDSRLAADHFLDRFGPAHYASDPSIVQMLRALRLPSHVSESEQALRWRSEMYTIRLSERGWGLLLGWLQGGGLAGTIEGTEARGRDRVLAIINERVKVETVPGPPAKSATGFGLASDFTGAKAEPTLDELKLGPAPVDPKLAREVARTVKSEDPNGAPVPVDGSALVTVSAPSEGQSELTSPYPAELPPYPQGLRMIDVAREVEKVREARKRIKLGGEAWGKEGGGAAKPSVCLFTIHDAGDTLTTTTFSQDSTLLAGGFSESFIRLWSLKGGKLGAIKSDFDPNEVTDASTLRKLREQDGPTTRKLIGHSGPVYALDFDPVPGPSAPPRYLLSASQDSTVRLWSLETYTNLVVYRGHREPVWDVQWGPRGIYFATASRDRTARLWATDKTAAIRIFAGHLSDVNCVTFHPNSLYIATGSADRTCRLWDVQKGVCVRVFVGHRGSVNKVAISPDGRYLASAAEDLTIILWDIASGKKLKSFAGHTSSIHSISFSRESSVLVSGSADATVRVWDVLAAPQPEGTGAGAVGGTKLALGMSAEQAKRRQSAVGGTTRKDEGALKKAFGEGKESVDLLATLASKRTPIFEVHFTQRNLVLACGPMQDA